jgi:AcrR family transcriptional regulator
MEAALREFAYQNFEAASVTNIVKKLKIAKGSVYQYFENKLDLWLFLKDHCEKTKMQYIQNVKRSDFKNFWNYYKAMYQSGIAFDLEQPLCSVFLYQVGFKESSPEVRPYLNTWKKKGLTMFTQMIDEGKKDGTFSKNHSSELMAHFMLSMSMSIADLMQSRYNIDFDGNIKKGKPLFAKNSKELMQAVDELVSLLQKALT